MALRLHFQEKLAEIRTDVIRMGTEANDMVRMAVDATLNGDVDLAARVMTADDRVDDFEKTVFTKAVFAVMQEAPVAADLRILVATLGIVGELENIGDDAVKLARRATKLSSQFPTELKLSLVELGEASRRSLSAAIRLYTDYSPELALQIVKDDKQIDTAYSVARSRVIDMIRANPDASEHLVRTIDAFHALEHVADHAVAIARRMQMLYNTTDQAF